MALGLCGDVAVEVAVDGALGTVDGVIIVWVDAIGVDAVVDVPPVPVGDCGTSLDTTVIIGETIIEDNVVVDNADAAAATAAAVVVVVGIGEEAVFIKVATVESS